MSSQARRLLDNMRKKEAGNEDPGFEDYLKKRNKELEAKNAELREKIRKLKGESAPNPPSSKIIIMDSSKNQEKLRNKEDDDLAFALEKSRLLYEQEEAAVNKAIEESLKEYSKNLDIPQKDKPKDKPIPKPKSFPKYPDDFTIIDIPGDGNCFYRAVSCTVNLEYIRDDASLHSKNALTLKKQFLKYINEHREDFELIIHDIDNINSMEDYIKSQSAPNAWAGIAEILAAQHVLKRPIYIYDEFRRMWSDCTIKNYETPDTLGIYLLYENRNHYNAMILNKDRITNKIIFQTYLN